jgi:hypothetical protein
VNQWLSVSHRDTALVGAAVNHIVFILFVLEVLPPGGEIPAEWVAGRHFAG